MIKINNYISSSILPIEWKGISRLVTYYPEQFYFENDYYHSFVVFNKKPYAIKKLLGEGFFAKVWLCQNEEGELFSLKQSNKKPNKSQIDILTKLNRFIGKAVSSPPLIYYLLIKYSDGVPFSKVFNTPEKDRNDELVALKSVNVFNEKGKNLAIMKMYFSHARENYQSISRYIREIKPSERSSSLVVNITDEFAKLAIAYKSLSKLANLHSMGIIHRDIKPQNMLLEYNFNKYKLSVNFIDFNLSKLVFNKDFKMVGTPIYLPPIFHDAHLMGINGKLNVARAKLSAATSKLKEFPIRFYALDVYSLGLILYRHVGLENPVVNNMLLKDVDARIAAKDAAKFIKKIIEDKYRDLGEKFGIIDVAESTTNENSTLR